MSSTSFPPSDTDGQTLYHFGLDLSQNTIGVIWESIFLSAYGVFFVLAVYSIFRRGLKSRSSVIMLLVVIYLYATSVTLWALNVTTLFKNMHSLLMDYPTMPLEDRVAQANLDVASLGVPMEALFMFNMLIGDSVVIWRAWVLYPRTLWAVSAPCILLLMSFIFTIIDITCLTGAGWSDQTSISNGGGVCSHAELLSWAFSLGTNASCTLLIGLKAWQHRRVMKSLNITGNGRRMSADKILSLLVESGFIYCLFWLTQLILFFPVSRFTPLIYVYEMFAGMGDQISGMYPTLIIVIVNLQHTIWDSDGQVDLSFKAAPGNTDGSASTIRWAWPSQRSVPVALEDKIGSRLGDERGIPMEDVSKAGAVRNV
ncbi:hypothetical protein FB45DRAFT_1040236 [Roridomyces roridus]|uniref:Uncharacterized protein n=1 Tax=Roridomyces roridus TaxID=1738132 RepID=A0AAD7F7U2_9AGAR|nr:hypothetical protein FB45DRAFT_1040236 [Roridomyces roridus]